MWTDLLTSLFSFFPIVQIFFFVPLQNAMDADLAIKILRFNKHDQVIILPSP